MKQIIPWIVVVMFLLGSCAGTPVRDAAGASAEADQASVSSAPVAPAGSAARAGDWFIEYPTLRAYGLTIVEAPRGNSVGAETLIVVSSSEKLDLIASVFRPGSTTSVSGMTQVKRSGDTWRCRIAFPESDDFQVVLSARRPTDEQNTYHGVAEWHLRAEVKPGERASFLPAKRERSPAFSSSDAKQALSTAVERGDVAQIKTWLTRASSANEREKAAAFPALESVLFQTEPERGAEIRDLLEAAGLDANLTDPKGRTLLQISIFNNRMDTAAWLLKQGANVNAQSRSGDTVLHYLPFSVSEPLPWLSLFLTYGVDVDAQDNTGDTALCYAAQSDLSHPFLVALVEAGADFNIGNNEGNCPLSHAWQHGAAKNTEYLKAKGARLYSYEFPVENNAPACRAVLSDDPRAVGSVPREDFSTMVARTSDLVPATPLHLAAEKGSLGVLQALSDRGVDWNVPDRYGRSPLQLAVSAGRADVVSLLLDYGADPNFADLHEATPFVVACATNSAIARQMLDRGITPVGESVAWAAVGSEDLHLVKALKGRIVWDSSAVSFAADTGLVEITEYLAGSAEAARAQENRNRFDEYAAQAARPLDLPLRSGGIARKRGTFPWVVDSWSPWLPTDKVTLGNYPVGVYVPAGYDGSRPFGLVVSMTNAKSSSNYPRAFTATLDKHNLIWVGFDPYKSPRGVITEFCLAIVYNMLGYYNIDQSRIYIGGYSLGGQLTEDVLKTHAWLFDGAFFINISFSGDPESEPEWVHCKHHVPIVYVEGDYDYNRSWTYRAYDSLLCSGYRNIYYIHEPMKGHKLISAESFERTISLLETGGK